MQSRNFSENERSYSGTNDRVNSRMKTDPISKNLLNLLNKIEDIYNLNKSIKTSRTEEVRNLGITVVQEYISSTVSFLPTNVRRSRNIEVSGVMGSVLYLSHVLKFKRLPRIDFSDHPGVTQLVAILGKFKNYDDCRYDKKAYLNAILKSLQLYESVSMMRINYKLSYKLVRVFYLMVVYDNLVDAAAIADLILNQLKLTMDYLADNGDEPFDNNFDRRYYNRNDDDFGAVRSDGGQYTAHSQNTNRRRKRQDTNNNTQYRQNENNENYSEDSNNYNNDNHTSKQEKYDNYSTEGPANSSQYQDNGNPNNPNTGGTTGRQHRTTTNTNTQSNAETENGEQPVVTRVRRKCSDRTTTNQSVDTSEVVREPITPMHENINVDLSNLNKNNAKGTRTFNRSGGTTSTKHNTPVTDKDNMTLF